MTIATVHKIADAGYGGPLKLGICSITFGTYATNGEAIDVTDIDSNLTQLWGLIPMGGNAAAADYRAFHDRVNSKVVMFDATAADAGDEVANSTDLSGVTMHFLWLAY